MGGLRQKKGGSKHLLLYVSPPTAELHPEAGRAAGRAPTQSASRSHHALSLWSPRAALGRHSGGGHLGWLRMLSHAWRSPANTPGSGWVELGSSG